MARKPFFSVAGILLVGCTVNNFGSVLPGVAVNGKVAVDSKDFAPKLGETPVATGSATVPSASGSADASASLVASGSATASVSPDATVTPAATESPSPTPVPTPAPTPIIIVVVITPPPAPTPEPTAVPTPSPTPSPTPVPKVKTLIRLVDGVLEANGEGIFAGTSASVLAQAVDPAGHLVQWCQPKNSQGTAGAFELQQDINDVTESTYTRRDDVKNLATFTQDVTGTTTPAVQIDLSARVLRLDPRQNPLGFSTFKLIGGWSPTSGEAVAAQRRTVFGKRTALFCLDGKQLYRWDNPQESAKPMQDWGSLQTRFVDEPIDSLVYLPAQADGATHAWFSGTTTTGKQFLVDEKYAESIR